MRDNYFMWDIILVLNYSEFLPRVCIFPLAACLGAWSIFCAFKLKFLLVFFWVTQLLGTLAPQTFVRMGVWLEIHQGADFVLFPVYQYQSLFRQFLLFFGTGIFLLS